MNACRSEYYAKPDFIVDPVLQRRNLKIILGIPSTNFSSFDLCIVCKGVYACLVPLVKFVP